MRRLPVLLAVALATLVAPHGAANAACTPDPLLPSDDRAAVVTCTGVHVGMMLDVPSQRYGTYACAAGYAFADQYGSKYVTFPGSCFLDYDCLLDEVFEQLPPPIGQVMPHAPVCINPSESELEPYYKKSGPIVKDTQGRRVGTIVYAVNKDGVDFTLMRVDPRLPLDHSVPFYGGPLRMGTAGGAEEAYAFSPAGYLSEPNARSGVLSGNADQAYFLNPMLHMAIPGSPVMRGNGDAIGNFGWASTLPWGTFTEPLREGIDRAQRRTGLKLRLLTAPLR